MRSQTLVSGIVRDESGVPVPNARIEVWTNILWYEPDLTWGTGTYNRSLLATETDLNGNFEVRSRRGFQRGNLEISATGFTRAQRAFNAPGESFAVQLAHALTLDARVEIEPELRGVGLEAVIEAQGPHGTRGVQRCWFEPDRAGRSFSTHAFAGSFRVEVVLHGGVEVLATSEFERHGAENSLVPGLEGVDLRGRYRDVTIHIVDTEGNPIEAGRVFVGGKDRSSRVAWPSSSSQFENGTFVFLRGESPLRVRVETADGRRGEAIDPTNGSRIVVSPNGWSEP